MDDFLVRALLAGLGLALVAGPLGCFLVWRRMAYFGETLSHAALLGIALGLLLEFDWILGILLVCTASSILLVLLQQQQRLAIDALLGIIAHGTLAFGLVGISFMGSVRIDLMAYLFGDILAVDLRDLAWIWGGALLVLLLLMVLWRPLLFMTVHVDLARVAGLRVIPLRLAFMLLISLVVAVAMKIVGLLLIVAMLIIPAAAARRLTRTPETMALVAAAIGGLAVPGGLAASLRWDTPAGPSIVAVATVIFFLVNGLPSLRRLRSRA